MNLQQFPLVVQEQLKRIAATIGTDLNLIELSDTNRDYLCADVVNKYYIGDRFHGGSGIRIREDVNKGMNCYTLTWYLNREEMKGDIRVYEDSTTKPIVDSIFSVDHYFI